MMEQRQNSIYPANLTDLLAVSGYRQNVDRLSAIADGDEKYVDSFENTERFVESSERYENRSSSPVSTFDDNDSCQYGVDLTGKETNLKKSFTIAAILGLTNTEEDVVNLSVQERLQSQRQLQNYLYSGHDVRINDSFRNMVTHQTTLRQGKRSKTFLMVTSLFRTEFYYRADLFRSLHRFCVSYSNHRC